MIAFKIVGAVRVRNNLRTMLSQNKQIFDDVIRDHTKKLQRTLSRKKAPPKRPNQTYKRTGKSQSSFSAKKIGPAVHAIQNSVDHAKYLFDEDNQAWMHQGRWFTIQEEERKLRPELTKALTKRAEEHFAN